MDSAKLKIVAACTIAAVGLLALGRMLMQNRPAPASSQRIVNQSEATKELAAGGFDTTPTAETVSQDIERAANIAKDLMTIVPQSQLPTTRRQDLADAFEERLSAVLDPNPESDAATRVARGQAPGFPSPDGLTNIQAAFQYRSFDLANLEVVTVFHRGERVAPEGVTEDGLKEGITRYSGKWAFPMSDLDPIEDRLTIIEVRLPVDTPIPPPGEDASERKLMGFQFVWSTERNQWIPWASVSRGGTGGIYGVPF